LSRHHYYVEWKVIAFGSGKVEEITKKLSRHEATSVVGEENREKGRGKVVEKPGKSA